MTSPDPALALIQEGWEHLRLQRPLAAWGSWQRALRIDPENRAASEALEILANAPELPLSARASYRFRSAASEAQRDRWTEAFSGRDLQDLTIAADAFRSMAEADPTDAAAFYNLTLCLAWQGRNPEALVALDSAVKAQMATDEELAVSFWTLGEVLRQGAGAETWADDVSHSLYYEWDDDWGDAMNEIAGIASLRPMPLPVDPITGKPPIEDVRIAEWLDEEGNTPKVLAVVMVLPGQVRLSSPVLRGLMTAATLWTAHTEDLYLDVQQEATPLPIRLMDTAVWRYRLPDEASDDDHRTQIEDYFENVWVQEPLRLSLGDETRDALSPAMSARKVAVGDRLSRVKLAAVVNVREQLAARPGRSGLYFGYPFDRLRRRLGILDGDSPAVDMADVSCMSEADLQKLDPSTLSDPVLLDAKDSAMAICDSPIVERFHSEIQKRGLATEEAPE